MRFLVSRGFGAEVIHRVLAGAVTGSEDFINNVLLPFQRNTGPNLSPFNAWVVLKGLETLPLRIREHLAAKGLGLHNDLQDESSIVGNFPQVIMMDRFGTEEQKKEWTDALITGERSMAFGLTEPHHGSDATWLETSAVPDGEDWVINGAKRFNTGVHRATHDLVFARTSGDTGQARGITAFLVPTDAPGFTVPYYWWTFNMPTDHGEVVLENVRVPAENLILGEGRGFEIAQGRLGPGRIHHCMRVIGAAERALELMVTRLLNRTAFKKQLAEHSVWEQRVARARIDIEMTRLLCLKAADMMDKAGNKAAKLEIAMIKVVAPNMACQVIDWAIQAHGGGGVSDDFPLAYAYASARTLRFADGPDEVHRNAIAKLELARYMDAGAAARVEMPVTRV